MKKSGFTLVELSIVLVIIGLIVGGVVGGQSLVASAKSQKIIKEIREIQVGWNAFQLQYDALPGDFSEATDYWPVASHSWMSNGDGDGKLGWVGNSEPIVAFEHMIVAELLQGHVGELSFLATNENRYGSSVVDGSNYLIEYRADEGANRLYLYVRTAQNDPILTPAQMKKIDKALDDGQPRRGKMRAYSGGETGAPLCYDTATSYNLDEGLKACYFTLHMD
jgi:prepilin-type N-terminal cleavage/methylation domain-containing protein